MANTGSTPPFAHTDTKRPDGFYVDFRCVTIEDFLSGEPDWLFQDEEYREQDQERLDAFRRGEWGLIGVRAEAMCMIVNRGVGTLINLQSTGLWGVASDEGEDYLEEIYKDEVEKLKGLIAAMHSPIYGEGA